MNKLKKEVLFKQGMVYVGDLSFKEEVQISKQDFYVLDKNLEKLGYKLNKELQEKLAYLSPEDFVVLTVDIINMASDVALNTQDLKIIFKDFQDHKEEDRVVYQVMDFLTYLFPELSDNYSLRKISDSEKLVYLRVGKDSNFNNYINSLFNSRTNFNEAEKELVSNLIELGYDIDVYSITMSENRAFVIAEMKRLGLDVSIKGTQELVDFIKVYYRDETPSFTSRNIKLRKLTNGERTNILRMFENLSQSEENIAKARYDIDFLKSLNRVLHARSKRNATRFPNAAKFFEILETNNISQYKSPEAKAIHLIANKDDVVFEVLKDNMGLYVRMISRLINAFGSEKVILDFVDHVDDVSVEMLYQLKSYFLNIENENRVFFFKGQYVLIENDKKYSNKEITQWLYAIDQMLVSKLKNSNNKASQIVVLPETEGWAVPKNNEGSAELVSLPYGSVLKTREDAKTISFIVYWDSDVDIDLSLGFTGDKDQRVHSSVAYYNLSNKFANHSGDVRGSRQGSTEIITVDLEKLKGSDVHTLIPNVILYSGYDTANSLKNVENLRFAVAYDLETTKGLNIKDLDKHFSIKLGAESSQTVPMIIDVINGKITWIDSTMDNNTLFSYSDQLKMPEIIGHAKLDRMRISDVVGLYALANNIPVLNSLENVVDDEGLVIVAPQTTNSLNNYNKASIFTESNIVQLNDELINNGFVKVESPKKEEVINTPKDEGHSIFDKILQSEFDVRKFKEVLNELK